MTVLFDEYEISLWFYDYCKNGNRISPELKDCITNSYVAYKYCKDIEDDPRVRDNITKNWLIFKYCKEVNSYHPHKYKLDPYLLMLLSNSDSSDKFKE